MTLARSDRHYTHLIRIGLFALTLLPIFWVSLRTFFTRLEPPRGRELKPAEAERLFRILERIRRKLQAPPIDKVLVDDQYNAAICQVPRFGLFGGHRNYLIIGLPYLLATPEDEMIATLAHEYGHLAGDQLLIQFSKLLRQSLPPQTLLFRMGGDEFLAVVQNVDETHAHQLGTFSSLLAASHIWAYSDMEGENPVIPFVLKRILKL